MTYLVLAAAILVVHAADIIYSAWALSAYNVKESNPIWKWAVYEPSLFWSASTLMMLGVLIGLRYLHCPAWALGFGLAARVMVMVRNVNIVRRAKSLRGDK